MKLNPYQTEPQNKGEQRRGGDGLWTVVSSAMSLQEVNTGWEGKMRKKKEEEEEEEANTQIKPY